MTLQRRRDLAGALLASAVLLLSGCDTSKYKVEILKEPPSDGRPVRIASSDEAAQFFGRITEGYSSRKGVRIEVIPTQSRNIPELVRSGAVDAGVVSGALPSLAGKKELVYVPFARDAIVFVAGKNAGIRSLTSPQIRRIFSGEITDWSQVGGKRNPINVVDRPPHSITRAAVGAGLFGGNFPKRRGGEVMETSELALQAMRSRPGHLGFAPMSRITAERFPGVILAVDGMAPIYNGGKPRPYPSRVEYGFLFPRNASGEVAELADFLLSREGWHQLATLGLAPAAKDLSLAACHCRERESSFTPAGKKTALAGTFTLAVVPELGAITQENRYAAICQQIADGLGVRARLLHLNSYDQVVSEFSEGKIDAAFVGSFVYGKLRTRLGVVPLARPESRGVSHYHGLIVVRRGSGLRSFGELRGKRFAYVAGTSAGELFPKAMVEEAGGSWPGFFSKLVRVISHEEAANLVRLGEVDGAAVKDLVLNRLAVSSRKGSRDLVVLASSDPFPENALVVAATLGERERSRLRDILLAVHEDEAGRKALRDLGADRMIPTSDRDYAGMYGLARKIRYRLDGGG